MSLSLDSNRSLLSVILGAVTLASVLLLLGGDAFPQFQPAVSHGTLAAFSLALIALAYLAHQIARRPAPAEFLKAILLAVAFLFWAANQFWADSTQATLFNDIAIALFVLDVFLVIAGWPRASPGCSFAESRWRRCGESGRRDEGRQGARCCAASCRGECCCAGPISAA
jgi:uncharacterized membrane protein